jgi:hypothetical protein
MLYLMSLLTAETFLVEELLPGNSGTTSPAMADGSLAFSHAHILADILLPKMPFKTFSAGP